MCSQTTKGTARKKTSTFYMEKGIGILWRGEYAPQRCTSTRERMDNKGGSSNVYGLWRM